MFTRTPEIYEQLVNPTPVIKYYFLSTFPKNTTGKVTTIQSIPPVDVKLWEKGRRYFWAYNYPNCSKYGPFKSEKLALLDATNYSSN